MTDESPSTASPFGRIALCLSGGGYRAATYALGCIDMLELAGYLGDVKMMSTVSGGTFTGVTYALSVADSKPYSQYYEELYEFLRDTNCVELALDDLYSTPSPSGTKDLSLIRSAAKVYDTKLFPTRGRTFDSLQGVVGDGKRFFELIHNATEFRKGNSFRFRASHNPNVFVGNGDFKVTTEIAGRIPLANIVASSSCFPGAFEPIRFPDDFMWAEGVPSIRAELVQDVKLPFGKKVSSGFKNDAGECIPLPLMDGGIYDNQGLSNAVEADRTVADPNVPIIDLFLICDTSARNDDMLRYPKPDQSAGWLSLNTLFWAAVALFFVSATATVFLVYYLMTAVDTRSLSWPRFFFQYLWPIALFVGVIGILIWAYRLFSKNKEIVVSGATFRLWPVVRQLSLPDLIDMIKARITSLGTMAGDVFMKRVRQLQFSDVMSSNRADKISFDLIYDLNPTKDRADLWKLDPGLQPTTEMKALSACAEQVPTTLWFPKSDQLGIREDSQIAQCKQQHPDDQRLLLACAQCTTCFSLLKYLWRRWQKQFKNDPATPKPTDPNSPYHGAYQSLTAIWNELKNDPYHFVDRTR